MESTTPLMIGATANCSDGVCGEVSRVVVDPVARAVTHLVVEPTGRQGLGRLVPLDLVDATGGEIQLGCTLAEFEHLDAAEETQFVPGTRGYAAYGPEQVLSWPYSSLAGTPGMEGDTVSGISETVTFDTIPSARWRCAAAIASMPPTARSGTWKGWSSTLATTM